MLNNYYLQKLNFSFAFNLILALSAISLVGLLTFPEAGNAQSLFGTEYGISMHTENQFEQDLFTAQTAWNKNPTSATARAYMAAAEKYRAYLQANYGEDSILYRQLRQIATQGPPGAANVLSTGAAAAVNVKAGPAITTPAEPPYYDGGQAPDGAGHRNSWGPATTEPTVPPGGPGAATAASSVADAGAGAGPGLLSRLGRLAGFAGDRVSKIFSLQDPIKIAVQVHDANLNDALAKESKGACPDSMDSSTFDLLVAQDVGTAKSVLTSCNSKKKLNDSLFAQEKQLVQRYLSGVSCQGNQIVAHFKSYDAPNVASTTATITFGSTSSSPQVVVSDDKSKDITLSVNNGQVQTTLWNGASPDASFADSMPNLFGRFFCATHPCSDFAARERITQSRDDDLGGDVGHPYGQLAEHPYGMSLDSHHLLMSNEAGTVFNVNRMFLATAKDGVSYDSLCRTFGGTPRPGGGTSVPSQGSPRQPVSTASLPTAATTSH